MREIRVTPSLRIAINWAIKYFSKEVAGNSGFYLYERDEQDMHCLQVDFKPDVFDLDAGQPSYLRHNTLHAVLSYYLNEVDPVIGRELWEEFIADRQDCPVCGPQVTGWIGYEHNYDHPKHYDGISVWIHRCGVQLDRFSGKQLEEHERVNVDFEKVHG